MIVKRNEEFKCGYTTITELNGTNKEMLLDFGILKLDTDDIFESDSNLERAYLLISGKIEFIYEDKKYIAERYSCFDEEPIVLHVSKDVKIKIIALNDSEICIERCQNETIFPSKIYNKDNVRTDIFGKDVLNNTSIRSVRTIFDGEIAPYSNMVMGEVINHPGKFSSYPPHDHPQPEIYHYKFFPKQGFGVSMLDDDAFVVKDGDTSLIKPDTTHSQVAAPGYAMYYIWMIPHLEDDRWLPTTRYYRDEHKWLLDKDVKIWPEKKFEK
ncbi:MAG: 5-deoxy-glucuronate isomerase [Pleomorphochaeta sp.]